MMTSKERLEKEYELHELMHQSKDDKEKYAELSKQMCDLIHNYDKELLEKYPWLAVHNWKTGRKLGYKNGTMYDAFPEGWRIAFGDEMIEEVDKWYHTLSKEKRKKFYVLQIKEKYGTLRCYCSFESVELQEIIRKYEGKSELTCVHCGKLATYISTGWICPWCDDCAKEIHGDLVPIKEWFKEWFKDKN